MCAMARKTLSGAPSNRSDKCTCTRPSRNRMVVFRLVKRRKRTSRAGIGARGRRARYSSANSKCNSEITAFKPSRTWAPGAVPQWVQTEAIGLSVVFCQGKPLLAIFMRPRQLRNCFRPSPFLFFLLAFLFFFFLLGDVFFFVRQHLHSRLMRALVGIDGRFAHKIVLGTGFWLFQDFRPFVRLGNDLFQ